MSTQGPDQRLSSLVKLIERTTHNTARVAWFVPGRVEVIGKHTDYAGGRSLVAAVERGICCTGAPRADGRLSIFDASRGSSVLLDPDQSPPAINWANYPLTVLRRLHRNFPDALAGADIVFDSDLPSASGLSSSSVLMVAVLLTLRDLNGLGNHERWLSNIRSDEDLAAYAATIENGSGFRDLPGERGVGTMGGSQDHTAILCSVAGTLAQFSYRPTHRERVIPLTTEWLLAVGVSGVRAQKTGNAKEAYNRAAARAGAILARWNDGTGRMDETLAAALASGADAAGRIRALLGDDAALQARYEQFLEESTVLVPTAGDQLVRGDLAGFGATVDRSQELAERLLGNQVPETIALARLARDHGAAAASAFGAGFGGSVWALIGRQQAAPFLERWQNAYGERHPDAAARSSFFLTGAGAAAAPLNLDRV